MVSEVVPGCRDGLYLVARLLWAQPFQAGDTATELLSHTPSSCSRLARLVGPAVLVEAA